MKTCGMQTAKYLLFGFNLLFVVSGLIILIVGAVILANMNDYSEFMESRVVGPPIVLIVVGLIIFLIAFLGCWGALREHGNMLLAYAILLSIVFIVEIAVGITAAVAKDDFKEAMKTEMNKSLKKYSSENVDKVAWDSMQKKLECCGVDNQNDWSKSSQNLGGARMPSSCCEMNKSCNQTGIGAYPEGCFAKLKEVVKNGTLILAGVGIGIAFIELAGIVLALLLYHEIRSSDNK